LAAISSPVLCTLLVNPDVNAVKGWAIMSYRSLYQKMLATGDYDGCRKVIKEITLLAT